MNSPAGVLGHVASLGSFIYAQNPSGPGFSVFPVQCEEVVSALVGSFIARQTPDGAVISWHLSETKHSTDFRLERRSGDQSEVLAVPASTASQFQVVDREATRRSGELRYILYGRGSSAGWSILAETALQAASTLDRTRLLAARPNPFNGHTQIWLELDEPARVEVAVYDVLGRRVRLLRRDDLAVGTHAIGWNGRDDGDREVASGVYFVRAKGSSFVLSQRVVFAK